MKTLTEIRDMIATTQAGETARILDICVEIVENLQRIETKLNSMRRVEAARDAAGQIADALKPYFTNNCTAAEQVGIEATTVGMIAEIITPILSR